MVGFRWSHMAFLLFVLSCQPSRYETNRRSEYTKFSNGIKISLFTDQVNYAREMKLSSHGITYFGMTVDDVYAIPYNAFSYEAPNVITIAKGLPVPNDVIYNKGSLSVAEIRKIIRYDNVDVRNNNPPEPVIINDFNPSTIHHGAQYIKFGPNGKLSEKNGYRLTPVRLNENESVSYMPFAEGWLQNGKTVPGRPVTYCNYHVVHYRFPTTIAAAFTEILLI